MNDINMLANAYHTVPYYNHVLNSVMAGKHTDSLNDLVFEDIPVHNKEDIRLWGWENFVSLNASPGNIIINQTTGTTGEPMDILWDKNDYIRSTANHWFYRYKYFHIMPSDRRLVSERHPKETWSSKLNNDHELVFNTNDLSESSLEHIINQITLFKPKWFYCEASVFYLLIKYAFSKGVNILEGVKGIEYKAEPILRFYQEFFDNHILAIPQINMYGCTETNGISFSCTARKQHVMSKNVYVEILDENNQNVGEDGWGNVCVTSLHNTLMPFLRYKLEDIGRLKKNIRCSCGCTGDVLELYCSRIPEILVLNDSSVCKEGGLLFPLNRFTDYQLQKTDVIFTLYRINLKKYVVSFDKSDNTDRIKSLFLTIVQKYGLNSSWFELVQSYPKKGGIKGVITIK